MISYVESKKAKIKKPHQAYIQNRLVAAREEDCGVGEWVEGVITN